MTQFRPGNFQILPVIIKNLLIINAIVFLAQITFDGIFPGGGLDVKVGYMADTFALHHFYSHLFKPWQLITHMFMHGSLMHIFSNMFALWMFGSVLENMWGPRRFLIFYLVCGLGAALLHLGFLWYENIQLLASFTDFKENPTLDGFIRFYNQFRAEGGYGGNTAYRIARAWQAEPNNLQLMEQAVASATDHVNFRLSQPTLGASGAVFGCLAAFGFLFPNTYIYLYFFIPIKAKWFVLLYMVFELSMAIRNSAGDNIARWAHLGGAIVGLILVYMWHKQNKLRRY